MKKHSFLSMLALAVLLSMVGAYSLTAGDRTSIPVSAASGECCPGAVPCSPEECAALGMTGQTAEASLAALKTGMASGCGGGSCQPCEPGQCSSFGTGAHKTGASLINAKAASPANTVIDAFSTGQTCDVSGAGCGSTAGCGSATGMVLVGVVNASTGEIKYVSMPAAKVRELIARTSRTPASGGI